jgi:hypothetical protein
MLRLDPGRGGARVAAQHQLAIDEERVGRAVDQRRAAAVVLEQHPRCADRPPQQLARVQLVSDGDAAEHHPLDRAVALDEQRRAVLDSGDAQHRRMKHHDEEKFPHGLTCGARQRRTEGVPWGRKG